MKTLVAAIAFLFATPALACEAHAAEDAHAGHNHVTTMEMSVPPSTKEYKDAMHMMHEDMNVPYAGDADIDFVRGMIPHHQGAIDMAKIQLKYGKDPEIRKLAEDVIKAQQVEIKMMKDWLAAHDTSAKKPATETSKHDAHH